MKIGIINTYTSNIQSVYNCLRLLGYTNFFEISTNSKNIPDDFTHVIYPGNGSFKSNIEKIKENKLDKFILDHYKKNKFFLGICVGMQILATYGLENGKIKGLDLIPGDVIKLSVKEKLLPHIGWNEVEIKKKNEIINKDKNSYYFLHSYFFKLNSVNNLIATCKYEENFPVIIKSKNFYGVQFHPEKSQKDGINLVRNFLNLK